MTEALEDGILNYIVVILTVIIMIGIAYYSFSQSKVSLKKSPSIWDISVGLKEEENISKNENATNSLDNNKVLSASEFKEFKVLQVTKISYNTKLIRFEIPHSKTLGLPIGRHISLKATIDGNKVVRAYTPTSRPDQKGYFELLIKKYEFGKLTPYLHNLKPGSSVEVRGPVGRFKYEENQYSCIGLIAGGTGITPCLQVIRCILQQPERKNDKTKFVLLYQNRTEEDILLKDELDSLAKQYPNRLQIFYFLSNCKHASFGITGNSVNEIRGYITEIKVNELLCPELCPYVCICGPSGFNDSMKQILLATGHSIDEGTNMSIYIW